MVPRPNLADKLHVKEIRDDMMKGNWKMRLPPALVLDAGGQTDHKLSSRLESVDFEGVHMSAFGGKAGITFCGANVCF